MFIYRAAAAVLGNTQMLAALIVPSTQLHCVVPSVPTTVAPAAQTGRLPTMQVITPPAPRVAVLPVSQVQVLLVNPVTRVAPVLVH